MPDREKVVSGFEHCIKDGYAEEVCSGCPYVDRHPSECIGQLMSDAICLLKERETVEPLWHEYGPYSFWQCTGCDEIIDHDDYKFCPHCGRAVKWSV